MGAGVSFTGVFPILVTPFDEKENVTNRVRHPGAQLVASAGEQLRSVMARVLPGVDITRPLAL